MACDRDGSSDGGGVDGAHSALQRNARSGAAKKCDRYNFRRRAPSLFVPAIPEVLVKQYKHRSTAPLAPETCLAKLSCRSTSAISYSRPSVKTSALTVALSTLSVTLN